MTFLKKLMRFNPMPAIVISSLAQPSCAAALKALELGAVEVMGKPGGPYSVGELRQDLAHKVRAAAEAKIVVGARMADGAASGGVGAVGGVAATGGTAGSAPGASRLEVTSVPPGTVRDTEI